MFDLSGSPTGLYAVVPVLVGPLSTLIALLPAILMAVGAALLSALKPSAMKKFALLLWAQKLAVLVVAAAGVGAWYGWDYVFAGPVEDVSVAESDAADWTMFRGGPERRGYVPGDAEDPGQAGRNWDFIRDGIKTFYASPAVVGNRVYITCADYGPLTDRGAIYAIDAGTGKLAWEYKAGGYRATFSSPSVAGKYLVCGEGLHYTRDARIVCLDLERSEKERRGARLWEYRTASHVESSPCIANGRVYIGAGDDGIYCIELEPDEHGAPRVVWHLDGKDYLDAESSPLVADGKVYFGLGEGGKAICCVDAGTGKELWRIATPYPVFGCPAVAEGRLYIGMGNGNFVETAEQVRDKKLAALRDAGRPPEEIARERDALGPVGEVWAVDLATHEVAWKFGVSRTVLGSVAIAGDRLYFGSRDGHLYCVSKEGEEIRKWNSHAPMVTSPAVAKEHVYFVTQAGMLHCLDVESLQPVWEMRIDTGGMTFSSPIVADGRVFVGTSQNGFVSLGQPGRRESDPVWAGPLGGPGRSGWDGSLVTERAAFAWRYPAPPPRRSRAPEPEIPAIAVPPASIKKRIEREVDGNRETVEAAFVYVALQYKDRQGIAALRLAADRGAAPELAWFHETPLAVTRSPAATVSDVYCVTGAIGDKGRQLLCLDADSGAPRWQVELADDAPGQFTLADAGLLIADEYRSLSCIPFAESQGTPGKPLWKSVDTGHGYGPAVQHDQFIAASTGGGYRILDAPTGKLLRVAEVQGGVRGTLLVTGEDATARIWLAQSWWASDHRIHDGRSLAKVACGRRPSDFVLHDGTIACTNEAGEIVLWDAETAAEIARIPGARPQYPPLFADDVLLFVDAKGESVQRHDLRTGQTTRWMDTAWLGTITTPPILIDSHLYFATDQRGLVCAKPAER
ncbi:MAG: PQQ-binding-like beta-propeller repeat protein [Planctomycetales bacterium]